MKSFLAELRLLKQVGCRRFGNEASMESLKTRSRRLIKEEEKKKEMLRSTLAVCTAESYDLRGMAKQLSPPSLFQNRDALHYREEESNADIFFFRHGSFVIWKNGAKVDEEKIRELIRPFEETPLPPSRHEREEIPFKYF